MSASPRSATRAAVWAERARLLATTLGRDPEPLPVRLRRDELGSVVRSLIDPADHSHVWLALSVMSGVIPVPFRVTAVARATEFDDGTALGDEIASMSTADSLGSRLEVTPPGTVLVDVATTVNSAFTTGIQRVVRQTVPVWERTYGAVPVAWTRETTMLRALAEDEAAALAESSAPDRGASPEPAATTLLVPWRATYVLPEVTVERDRCKRTQSIAQYACGRSGALGYDLIPLTSSETLATWDGETFTSYVAALSHFDAISCDSEAAATEFKGWRRSLRAIGRDGPDVRAVSLAETSEPADPEALAQARFRFQLLREPLVLVVGSREPRKNHLAVLHAAELLWREGHVFRLCFAGARMWAGSDFSDQVEKLRGAGRDLDVAADIDDRMLAALYELARFTVFPSLHEGFGLPVVESLSRGTPVVTTDYGSMAEIAADGGALTVDPRDDHAIADAMRRLLTDDALLAELESQARQRPPRTWDDYARESWSFLVGGD